MNSLAPAYRHLAATASLLFFCAGPACSETFRLPASGNDIVGKLQTVIAKETDTLLDIGRRHGLGYSEITAANPGVDPWLPGVGTRIVLPTQFVLPPGPRRGIVLNLAQLRLFYFPLREPGKPTQVMTHPVGIGTDYASTPLGETRVLRKAVKPVWRPSRNIREEHAADGQWLAAEVPPGPDNPLGKYALYLALKGGYIIHGTNKPWGVGMRVSHGCIRLYPEGIESLYPQVPVGTPVRVINERLLVGVSGGVPYLQVFHVMEQRNEEEGDSLTPDIELILRRLPRGQAVDWDKVMGLLRVSRSVPVPIAPGTLGADRLLEDARASAAAAKSTAPQPGSR